MASISSVLRRINDDLNPFLSEQAIVSACLEAGHRWRRRQLGPAETIHLFILQILNFNTAMTALRHLSKKAVEAPAYCRARMRLPLKVLQKLLVESSAAMREACASSSSLGALWCGLKTYLVDGSSTIAPDRPDSQKAFGQPKGCKKGCGFPVPKMLGLFDAFSGLIVQALGFPLYTHEQSKVWMLHPLLGAGDLLVGDRGFCSFAHLSMLLSRGIQGLFRIHQKVIVDFRPHRKHRRKYRKGEKAGARPVPHTRFIKRLGKHDQIVEWFKPSGKPKWMSQEQYAQLPESLFVRELRFTLPRRGQRTRVLTIATTLLDPILYPKEQIVELYGVRWRVETHFGQLKTLLKMRKVKSKTSQGVLKELTVYALVYNLVHVAMLKAAQRQGVLPHRISFIDTVRWLLSAEPGEPMPELIIIPHRPDRHEPRVVKDQQDTYTKMTRPRAELRKELKTKAVAA
jgi:Transposase DDE domain